MSVDTSHRVIERSIAEVQSQGLLPTGYWFRDNLAWELNQLMRDLAPLATHLSDEMIDQNVYTMAAVALTDVLLRSKLDMGVPERVLALESLLNEIRISHKETITP